MYVIAIFLTDNNQQSNSPVCVALQHKDALCACRRAYKRKSETWHFLSTGFEQQVIILIISSNC